VLRRRCEGRSDAAIQRPAVFWLASLRSRCWVDGPLDGIDVPRWEASNGNQQEDTVRNEGYRAIVAAAGAGRQFGSARDFAAWAGLTRAMC
jgi:hypothetical protein